MCIGTNFGPFKSSLSSASNAWINRHSCTKMMPGTLFILGGHKLWSGIVCLDLIPSGKPLKVVLSFTDFHFGQFAAKELDRAREWGRNGEKQTDHRARHIRLCVCDSLLLLLHVNSTHCQTRLKLKSINAEHKKIVAAVVAGRRRLFLLP